MSENNNEVHFNFSYNELINLSFEKEAQFTRDVADLTPRGITPVRITAFQGLRNTFLNVPQDGTLVANITIAKNNRDAAAEPLRIGIREVQGIAANTFGVGSAEHKTFLPQALTDLDAGALLHLAPVVVVQGNTFMAQMSAKGLTAPMLAAITTEENTLAPLCTAFSTAEGLQLLSTKNRHIAANALYDEMSEMCETAIVYYQDRDPLKASLYVIYDTAGNSQQRNGSIAVGEVVYRSFEGLETTTLFKLQVKDGNDLVFYFSQTEGGTAGTKNVVVGVDPNNYTEVSADDLGFDRATGYIKFNIRNNGSVESIYRVVVD